MLINLHFPQHDRMVSVAKVARFLGVSPARVRKLLAQGRLYGRKDAATGFWQVGFPPTIKAGTRGPRLGSSKAVVDRSKHDRCATSPVAVERR